MQTNWIKKLTFLLLIGCMAAPQILKATEEGEKLFRARCAACHSMDRRMVGPPMKGITDKREHDWLVRFIRNSMEMVQAGDKDAVAIYEEYNKMVMPPHMDMSDDQIDAILAYIADYSASAATASTGGDPGNPLNLKKPLTTPKRDILPAYIKSNLGLWTAIFGAIFMLIAVMYLMAVANDAKPK